MSDAQDRIAKGALAFANYRQESADRIAIAANEWETSVAERILRAAVPELFEPSASEKQTKAWWRPLETAPRDGTKVDLHLVIRYSAGPNGRLLDTNRIPEAYWREGAWRYMDGPKEVEIYGGYVTHWMPLPEPPDPPAT